MKIALINENSQAAKNALIEATLRKVVEPMGHEVVNYGMYAADDAAQLTYVQNGILGGLAVFIDQCNFHGLISPVYYILEGSRVVCSGNPIYHITSSRKYLVFTV